MALSSRLKCGDYPQVIKPVFITTHMKITLLYFQMCGQGKRGNYNFDDTKVLVNGRNLYCCLIITLYQCLINVNGVWLPSKGGDNKKALAHYA